MLLILSLLASSAHGETPTAVPANEPSATQAAADDMSAAHELVLYADMPVIISASRQSQNASLSSVPVSVISADDIHFSGLNSLADLLRQVPGMDVLHTDRNTASVGIRGLHHAYADRTLVLIDGRNNGSILLGGADFGALPIFAEDIARIEVVRGPGGAAWGANALNGVVNIIMKRPEEAQGILVSSTINEYGDTFNQLRWGAKTGSWSWRLSAGYEDFEDSEDAIAGDDFVSYDFGRTSRFDGEAQYRMDSDATLSFGASAAHIDHGTTEILGYPAAGTTREDDRIDVARFFVRQDRKLDDGSSCYFQWFANIEDENRPSLARWHAMENDLETQWNFKLDRHDLSFGGNARWITIDADKALATDFLATNHEDSFWLGAFVIDRWELDSRWSLEGQFRVDWYSETQADFSGRYSLLYGLDDNKDHVLRVSAARAFRAPLYSAREQGGNRIALPTPPFPPGSFALNNLQASDLDHESVWSLETGCASRLSEHWSFNVNSYYQIYQNLIGVVNLPEPAPVTGARFYNTLDNIDGAVAWGFEPELVYQIEQLRASVWYAYNDLQEDQPDQSTRAVRPARHKVGVTGRVFLPLDACFNMTYRWTAATENDIIVPGRSEVPDHHCLDLTLSKTFLKGQVEALVGVTDLLDQTDLEVIQVGSQSANETPGRTIFGRIQVHF
ncbi:MAG: TonB-dependent receptor [Phycisphaeraceae bacterium]|nr:TonB-dependent receptor [Phycisphaeraceae bacterium]